MKLIGICLCLFLSLWKTSAQEKPNPFGDGHINYPREYPTSVPSAQAAMEASIQNALSSMETRLWRDYAKGKTNSMKEFIRDDAMISISTGATSKREWIAQIESGECKLRSFRLKDFVLDIRGPRSAEIRYRAEQDASCDGKTLANLEEIRAAYSKTPDVWRDGRWWEGEWRSTNRRENAAAPDQQ